MLPNEIVLETKIGSKLPPTVKFRVRSCRSCFRVEPEPFAKAEAAINIPWEPHTLQPLKQILRRLPIHNQAIGK